MKPFAPIIIVLLLVSASFVGVSYNLEQSTGNTITVDNEGDGDYTSIKQALNNANPGDTIEVYSGTYYERGIKVEKEGITFLGVLHELGSGNDTGKPIIYGESKNYVFLFDARNVTLDNFHIDNTGGPTVHDVILIDENTNGCVISNNELLHTYGCLIYCQGSFVKIINNKIAHSISRYGICLRYLSNNCLVSGNSISDVEDGIKLWSSNNNTVICNRVSNCSRFGIEVASDGNHIEGNSIEYNKNGIHMYGADFNSILNNNLMNNDVNVRYIFEIPGLIKMIMSNRFDGNYWDDWIGVGPKLIWGLVWLLSIPVFDIDWHPAQEPYDI